MVRLPGGFSPWQAIQQIADDANPFDGGSRDRDVFSEKGNQYRGGPNVRPINQVPAIVVNTASGSGNDSSSTGGTNRYSAASRVGGGSSAPSYSPEDLAYLDSQMGRLSGQLGRTDTTLANSLAAILENYQKELSGANTTRSRNIEDFNTKTQVSESGRSRELGKVDTNARVLANSLRQRLGLAGGRSSASEIAAPKAVQREQSEQRGDVLNDYSANFMALDTDKRRSEEDYKSLLDELEKQRVAREGGVVGDIESQRNQIRDNLGRVAGERAKLLGGGYNAVRQAMSPYEAQIAQGESLIDSIFSKYAAKYDVKPLQVNDTKLRDYAVDPASVQDQGATGSQDPYAQALKPKQDDEENLNPLLG